MKKRCIILFFSLFYFPFVPAFSIDFDDSTSVQMGNRLLICQDARQRALQQRGNKIIGIRDDLVKNTLRSYGGDYFKDGEDMSIMLNGRIYRNFTLKIIRGQFLLINTRDGVFCFEVVTE